MTQEELRHRRQRIYDFLMGHLWSAEGQIIRENVEMIIGLSIADQAAFRTLVLDLAEGMSEEGFDREEICGRLAEELTWEHEKQLVNDVVAMERMLSRWVAGTGPQSVSNARDYASLRDRRFNLFLIGLLHDGLQVHKTLKSALSAALTRFLAGESNGRIVGDEFEALIAANPTCFSSRTGKKLKEELKEDARALSLPLTDEDRRDELSILNTWRLQRQHRDTQLSDVMLAYNELTRLVGEAAEDVARSTKGNKAAGVRVRKIMQEIKIAAQRLRNLLTKTSRSMSEDAMPEDVDADDKTETS